MRLPVCLQIPVSAVAYSTGSCTHRHSLDGCVYACVCARARVCVVEGVCVWGELQREETGLGTVRMRVRAMGVAAAGLDEKKH